MCFMRNWADNSSGVDGLKLDQKIAQVAVKNSWKKDSARDWYTLILVSKNKIIVS